MLGVQCVMMDGTMKMQEWFAGSWDIQLQEASLLIEPHLVKVQEQY
jgi:hypothetical protein